MKDIKMKNINLKTLVTAILAGNLSLAQEITPQVQTLVNSLAKEGYEEFRLEDGPFIQPTLVAEIDDQALELILDPDTQEVVEARISFDDDGNGTISRNERRKGIRFDELPEQASERAEAAIKLAREKKRIRSENKAKDAVRKSENKAKTVERRTENKAKVAERKSENKAKPAKRKIENKAKPAKRKADNKAKASGKKKQ